ncbi:Peptidase C14 [Colletotrichum higginsianum IMI 349063]|uniref:Peptidase C14 n=1 Tax=Colletotrichum higginsianum (strain IMI 349063) TaxID=759273 RepID=A0A1B7XQZ1_COLHI|nr:Peptidase C14 [Colletotrichum higginsianum IMI 349063]OBR02171.1 Peptidase C14 [Colletotrichum higginsianum IMI 349063]
MLAQALSLTTATVVFYLLLRTILARNRSTLRCNRKPPSAQTRLPADRASRGVRVCQVYPTNSNVETDIDIIAVHGLDTNSPETWEDRSKGKPTVNWLADEGMLPHEVPHARIFTCDWPADLFRDPNVEENRIDELARLLLEGILGRPQPTDKQLRNRPILFIASCLGGIVLMKALEMAYDKYLPVQEATCGVIFLATPFSGTSFEKVAGWAEPGLRTWASFRGQGVTQLLDWVNGDHFDLDELVRRFTALYQKKAYKVHTFYENGFTDLSRKVPLLSFLFPSEKTQLVNKRSATLPTVQHPLPLERNHVRMNKFRGPKDSDPDYKLVVDQIRHCLEEIRKGTPLERADAWIRNEHYTEQKLKIERLSGDPLRMDQCYINLALVELQRADSSERRSEEPALRSSPFSLSDRLKIETPHKDIQVKLEALFDPRKMPDGHVKPPQRILIRGRAGVGKTTLCKKIVYDFTHGTLWHDKFDRLLWIPLRNLKREARTNVPGYNMGDLFRHEYFSTPEATDLIDALWKETYSALAAIVSRIHASHEMHLHAAVDTERLHREGLRRRKEEFASYREAVRLISRRPVPSVLCTISQGEKEILASFASTAKAIDAFVEEKQPAPSSSDDLWDSHQEHHRNHEISRLYRICVVHILILRYAVAKFHRQAEVQEERALVL